MKQYTTLSFAAIILSGCSLFTGGGGGATQGVDGGVFKSFNRGETFFQIASIPSVGGVESSIANTNVVSFAHDPQDRLALYIGTRAQGMFYTYNGGVSWTKSPLAPASRVNAIAVDPKDKCTIYAAVGNQVFKSIDCSRSWAGTYIQNVPDQTILTIAVDPTTPSIVYAGDVRGNVFKSTDFAGSWSNVARFTNPVNQLLISTDDPQTIYAATANRGLRRSSDAGDSWEEIIDALTPFPGALTHKRLILNPAAENSLIYASSYGILKTEDRGDSWAELPLLTAPRSANIFSLAVNPVDDNELYYATERTLYSTFDGGQQWITKQNGTSRLPTYLWVDPVETDILYMTVAAPIQQ